MLFSIIMPVYNVKNYLQRAIDSVLEQSCIDWELIIVNDGSTDGSKIVCENFAKENNRIKLINQNNQGSGPARQKGLQQSIGRYIVFLDPDDFLENEALANVQKIISDHNADIIFSGYKEIIKTKQGHVRTLTYTYNEDFSLEGDKILDHFEELERVSVKSLWNKVYSKKFLKENQLMFSDQRVGQDALFNYRAYRYVQSIYVSKLVFYNYDTTRECSAVKLYNQNKGNYELNIADTFKEFLDKRDHRKKHELTIREYWYALFMQILNLSREGCELSVKDKIKKLQAMIDSREEYKELAQVDAKYIKGFLQKVLYKMLLRKKLRATLMFCRIYCKMFLE